METLTAIRAKVFFIIGVFHAHTFAAIGRRGAAIKTKPAGFALIYLAERGAALLTYMFNPIAAFNTIIAAVAAFVYGVIVAAVGAKLAKAANFKTVVKKTAVTLRAYYAAINAVVAAVSARFTEGIAVAAFGTVHILALDTILAPSAIGANKSTVRAFPTVSAKFVIVFPIANVFAFRAMKAIAQIAIFTQMALITPNNVLQTCAAVSAMSIVVAGGIGTVIAARAAHTAHIIVIVPMPAKPALLSVLPTGKCRYRKYRQKQYHAQQNT